MLYHETNLANFLFENEILSHKKRKSWQNSPFFRRVTEEFVRELNASGLLKEGVILESRQLLEEGFWDAVQSGIGNVAGGIDKFLKKVGIKKEPKDYEQVQKIFDKVMARESNKKVKDLVDSIKKFVADEEKKLGEPAKNQVFPYNKHAEIFIKGCEMLAAAYDSLKKSIEDKEFPVAAGNEMINALRIATEKFLRDTEREKGGMYASFGTGGVKSGDVKVGAGGAEVTENFHRSLILGSLSNLLFEDAPAAGGAQPAAGDKKEGQPSADVTKDQMEKALGDPKNVEKMKQLTSMNAPKIIAAAGLGAGVLGAFFMSPLFVKFVEYFFSNPPQTFTEKSFVDGSEEYLRQQGIPTNGKLTQTFHAAMKANGINHPDIGNNTASTIGDFKTFLGDLGGLNGKPGDINAGRALWASACQDPAGAQKGLDLMLNMPDTANYNRAIGAATKFSGLPGKAGFFMPVPMVTLLLRGIRPVATEVTKQVVVKGGLTKTGAALLKGGTMLGPWLAAIGIGAVAAGGTLAVIRKRARSKSRLGILTDLKGQMLDVENPGGEVTPPPAGQKIKIIITLSDDGTATVTAPRPKEEPPSESTGREIVKAESFIGGSLSNILFEDATVDVVGNLTIDGRTENYHNFKLVDLSMSKYPPPKVENFGELPNSVSKELKSKIEKILSGFDIDSPDVSIEIRDQRKKKGGDQGGGGGGGGGGEEPVEFKKKGPIEVTITLFDNDRVKVSLRPEDRSAMMTIDGKKMSSYDFDIEGTLPKLKVKPRVTNFRDLPRDYSDRLEDEIMRILDGFRFNDRSNKIMLQDRRTEKSSGGGGKKKGESKLSVSDIDKIIELVRAARGGDPTVIVSQAQQQGIETSSSQVKNIANIVKSDPDVSASDVARQLPALPPPSRLALPPPARESRSRNEKILNENVLLRWKKLAGI